MKQISMLCLALLIPAVSAADLPDRLAGLQAFLPVCVPTHIGIFGDVTTVTSKHQGIFYREGKGPWSKVPVPLNGPHSIVRLPNGRWIISDTDNNQMIEIAGLARPGKVVAKGELGGFKLMRPHDEIVDPINGDIYVIDGNRRLFRFKDLAGPVEVWEFKPQELGYSRALSWFDGRLHLVSSSRGQVLRVDDFVTRKYTVFRGPRGTIPATAENPYQDFDAGALSTTGIVLNDVDKSGGWYYGTNFFTPDYAQGGDTAPARLIRWRTWEEFQRGQWQDISASIPVSPVPLTPYFITIKNGVLYTGLFDHDEPSFGPTDRKTPCRYDRLMQMDLATLPPRVTP